MSQILFARHAFPPESFQHVELDVLSALQFDDIVSAEAQPVTFDEKLLRDRKRTVFFRPSCEGYDLCCIVKAMVRFVSSSGFSS